MERRNFSNQELRFHEEGEKQYIVGHAAVFNVESRDLGGFTEVLEEGAFDNVLEDDVRALFNHDRNMVLARTKSGTLSLAQTDRGLEYRFEAPDTTAGKDLKISLKRGDIDESSFGFSVREDGDKWERREGKVIRTIKKGGIERLYDVSPVTFAAYPKTDVAQRSLEEFISKESQEERADGLNPQVAEAIIKTIKIKRG